MMTGQQQSVPSANPLASRPVRRRRAIPARPDSGTRLRPHDILVTSLWFGLIIGLGELALTLVQKPLTDPSPGLFRMNRHIVWTIPTVDLAVFALCGLAASLLIRLVPRHVVRLVFDSIQSDLPVV